VYRPHCGAVRFVAKQRSRCSDPYPDGERAPWPEVVSATSRIVRSARIPVTADIEAGYGATASEVHAHVAEIIRTWVVGINLEDGFRGTTRSITEAAERIRAARDAAHSEGVPIVINARCDIYHLHGNEGAARLPETIERCKDYLAAGADCVYAFGVRDGATIAALVEGIAVPVNITGRAGMPSAAALEHLGVARITIASAPALIAMSGIQELATELHATRSFDRLAAALRHPDAQKLFQ